MSQTQDNHSSDNVNEGASINWLEFQKSQKRKGSKSENASRKRRRLLAPEPEFSGDGRAPPATSHSSDVDTIAPPHAEQTVESLEELRNMIHGNLTYTPKMQTPGKYLALDCEMVGVGIDASESSLARVSLVNFYGAVQMDEFVRQRERVVDYRTHVSGVRETDVINAKPFPQVQQQVADLVKGRILIGHAVSNDLKALLLTHPRAQTRDTQFLASKHKLTRSKRPALRNLVQQELDVQIQSGEHSSVTDARATMALYRLHRKEWEKGRRMQLGNNAESKKRKCVLLDGPQWDTNHSSTKTSTPTIERREDLSHTLSLTIGKCALGGLRSRPQAKANHFITRRGEVKSQWWKELI